MISLLFKVALYIANLHKKETSVEKTSHLNRTWVEHLHFPFLQVT